jgi:hypothetical protein
VRRSHLISYQEDGALLQELFSRDGIGTQIVMESAEQIRRATINDIGGILELIARWSSKVFWCVVRANSWRWRSINSPLFSAIT